MINNIKNKILNSLAFRNGLLCIIGYIFNKAIAFFMIPILSRIILISDYGIINTYTSWLSILSCIIGLGMEYSIRNAYVDFKDKFEEYITSVCEISLINLFFCGNIIFIINKFILNQENDLICILCIIHSYVYVVINYFNNKYTMEKKYSKRLLLLIIPNLLSSILGIILILRFQENKYMGRIWGYVLVFIPVGVFLIINQIRKNKNIFCLKKYWRYSLKISLPMIFHGLSNVVLSSSDRIIINKFLGSLETGIYSLFYNCSLIIIGIIVAIENIWIPWFTKQMVEKKYNIINEKVVIYIKIVLTLIIIILMTSPEIIDIIATTKYSRGKFLLTPLIISGFFIFLYSLSIGVELFYKKNKYIALNTILAAILNIIFDIIFIPIYGLKAAAYVTLISYIFLFIVHYRNSRKLNKIIFPIRNYISPIFILMINCFLFEVFINVWFIRWSICILFVNLLVFQILKKESNL